MPLFYPTQPVCCSPRTQPSVSDVSIWTPLTAPRMWRSHTLVAVPGPLAGCLPWAWGYSQQFWAHLDSSMSWGNPPKDNLTLCRGLKCGNLWFVACFRGEPITQHINVLYMQPIQQLVGKGKVLNWGVKNSNSVWKHLRGKVKPHRSWQ